MWRDVMLHNVNYYKKRREWVWRVCLNPRHKIMLKSRLAHVSDRPVIRRPVDIFLVPSLTCAPVPSTYLPFSLVFPSADWLLIQGAVLWRCYVNLFVQKVGQLSQCEEAWAHLWCERAPGRVDKWSPAVDVSALHSKEKYDLYSSCACQDLYYGKH